VDVDRQLTLAFEHAPSAMLLSSLDGAVLRANAAARDLLGRGEEELRQLGWTGLTGAPLENGNALTVTRADGSHLDADVSSSVFEGEDGIALCVTVLRPRAAGTYHDPVTGLPNATLFSEHLEIAVARAAREQSSLAVLSVQLDGFEKLTDLHGEDVRDEVLRQVAYRLRASARLHDVPARRGTDDFLVLVADLGRKVCVPATEGIALRIEDALSMPFKVGNELVACSARVGFAIYPKQIRKVEALVAAADAALEARRQERPAAA
jgi:diguanylate cyclase (GGDEF)-like protein